MAKVTMSKLKLKKDNSVSIIKINEVDVEIKKYISVEDYIDLVEITYQQTMEDSEHFNPYMISAHFWINFIASFTNIKFTDIQRQNDVELLDLFIQSGALIKIKEAFSQEELIKIQTECVNYINQRREDANSTRGTFEGLFDKLSNTDIANEKMLELIKNSEYRDILEMTKQYGFTPIDEHKGVSKEDIEKAQQKK